MLPAAVSLRQSFWCFYAINYPATKVKSKGLKLSMSKLKF